MYVLAFGEKHRIFLRGVPPFGPPPQQKIKKNHKNIFAPDPQFLFYNLLVLEELRFLEKTRAQKNENLPSY